MLPLAAEPAESQSEASGASEGGAKKKHKGLWRKLVSAGKTKHASDSESSKKKSSSWAPKGWLGGRRKGKHAAPALARTKSA
ncbi:hypothetical protein GNI_076250, partial [Gregarina niphandrodes]